jgi:hypothetical protein
MSTTTNELDARRVYAAKNQSVFREVNERIEEIAPPSSFIEFICECADPECGERLAVTLQEYEGVRSKSSRFFVLPGHELLDVEKVVESSERYLMVETLGTGRRMAEGLDPRRRVARLRS